MKIWLLIREVQKKYIQKTNVASAHLKKKTINLSAEEENRQVGEQRTNSQLSADGGKTVLSKFLY